MIFGRSKAELVSAADALPGRATPIPVAPRHAVLGTPLAGDVGAVGEGLAEAFFAAGCFWGVERVFWQTKGVRSTAVGYQGGHTPNPTYEEVCSGLTGHAEAVRVVFDPREITYDALLRVFFEAHDPTQGMRQGNDRGTQYRSAVYTVDEAQAEAARRARDAYQAELTRAGYGEITTELAPAGPFYYAEDYHQQYLFKVPNGYCGVGGTGVSCPVGLGVESASESAGAAQQ